MQVRKNLFLTILWLALLIINLVSLIVLAPDLKILNGSALISACLNLMLILIAAFYFFKQIKKVKRD